MTKERRERHGKIERKKKRKGSEKKGTLAASDIQDDEDGGTDYPYMFKVIQLIFLSFVISILFTFVFLFRFLFLLCYFPSSHVSYLILFFISLFLLFFVFSL